MGKPKIGKSSPALELNSFGHSRCAALEHTVGHAVRSRHLVISDDWSCTCCAKERLWWDGNGWFRPMCAVVACSCWNAFLSICWRPKLFCICFFYDRFPEFSALAAGSPWIKKRSNFHRKDDDTSNTLEVAVYPVSEVPANVLGTWTIGPYRLTHGPRA